MAGFLVETKGAMEKLDELLKLKGIDVALVGPNDLSIALGGTSMKMHLQLSSLLVFLFLSIPFASPSASPSASILLC